jgi:hypothetical protein
MKLYEWIEINPNRYEYHTKYYVDIIFNDRVDDHDYWFGSYRSKELIRFSKKKENKDIVKNLTFTFLLEEYNHEPYASCGLMHFAGRIKNLDDLKNIVGGFKRHERPKPKPIREIKKIWARMVFTDRVKEKLKKIMCEAIDKGTADIDASSLRDQLKDYREWCLYPDEKCCGDCIICIQRTKKSKEA